MASSGPQKIFIQVESQAEQQENLKNTRKSSKALTVLQKTGTNSIDKENLIGRQPSHIKEQLIRKTIENELAQTPEGKRKIPTSTTSSSAQTSPSIAPSTSKIQVEDLTSETVGEHYWEVLAEKRRVALDESLIENQELYERIAVLEDELNQSKTLLTEARNLVEVLTEMLEEKDAEPDTTTQALPSDEDSKTSDSVDEENAV